MSAELRVFAFQSAHVSELAALPGQVPEGGFVWLACTRDWLADHVPAVQAALTRLTGSPLLDLHVSDLLNAHLPSHFDDTSQYDMLAFRRLASSASEPPAPGDVARRPKVAGPPVLRRIDTSPVGFAAFDRVLLSVHPADCAVRDAYATRLLAQGAGAGRQEGVSASARGMPQSPADLMLRMVSSIIDAYLDLRRELTRQLDHWQTELLDPRARFSNWAALLHSRMTLHQLDDICEDQRSAIQDWLTALQDWPTADLTGGEAERELLRVRGRDVLEHIERVAHHVRRLETNAETAVQMHFSAQSHRTNDIMRTLTAITAIFLPLNLITGFFGMNFEFMPLIHHQTAFWWTVAVMVTVAVALGALFWRKRYLTRTGR